LGQGIAVDMTMKLSVQTLRRLETVAVGDKVLWTLSSPGQGRIEEILPDARYWSDHPETAKPTGCG